MQQSGLKPADLVENLPSTLHVCDVLACFLLLLFHAQLILNKPLLCCHEVGRFTQNLAMIPNEHPSLMFRPVHGDSTASEHLKVLNCWDIHRDIRKLLFHYN